jgi:hypothetical protein
VAVRADELALGDLLEHAAAVVLPAQVGNGGELGGAGQVVPLHRRRVIAVAAVGARLSLLQPEVPLDELGVALALLLDANRLSRSVILRVVAPPAVLAPCLVSAPAAVEVLDRFVDPTTTAALRHPSKVGVWPDV